MKFFRVRKSSMMLKRFKKKMLKQRRLKIERVFNKTKKLILSHLNKKRENSMRLIIKLKKDEDSLDLSRNYSNHQLMKNLEKLRKRFLMGLLLTDCIKKLSMTKI